MYSSVSLLLPTCWRLTDAHPRASDASRLGVDELTFATELLPWAAWMHQLGYIAALAHPLHGS